MSWHDWANEIPNDGFIRYYGLLNIEKILVTDPKAAHEIFAGNPYSYIKPPPITKIIKALLGDGLIVVEGDAHKAQKKIFQPAFKVRQLNDLCAVFEAKARELLVTVDKDNNGFSSKDKDATVDLGTYLHRATLDVIGFAGFGLDFNCLKDPENQLATDYAQGFNPSPSARKYRLLALVLPGWLLDHLPLKRNQDLRATAAAVRRSTGEMIEERGARIDAGKTTDEDNKDIIGTLMAHGGVRDKKSLINQSMTILGAGHDTVHFAISSAIWEMCKNPKIQQRLRAEVREHLHLRGQKSISEKEAGDIDIDNLPYLQAVVNETLRLHHSVPTMYRRSIEPTVVAGTAFPKGTNFIFPLKAYNVSSKFWKSDPTVFNPERWVEDPALGGAADRKAFMTFSTGARHCIGEKFGRLELKHLLAGLIGSYNMTWAGTGEDGKSQKMVLEHGITSKMIGSLHVKMEPLGGWEF